MIGLQVRVWGGGLYLSDEVYEIADQVELLLSILAVC